MEYYRILNLEQEPFSNSPDPGLFFNSKQHLEALQMLEISIRLKRGLSVVTGNVGTGKTTISRQLVKRISDDPELNYFLVLDPGFKTVNDFLGYLLNLFTGENPLPEEDENSTKERIKNVLFTQGVDKKITTVLIIDEGQKLPVFCLEALRELLNYETNDQKLLQIIIFAQMEFDDAVAGLDNFKDRINFRYSLGPLTFRETRGMIQYRLERSGVPGTKGTIFSSLAYLAVYRFTKGYPRKIVNLCHHIILALIIQNKSRAGWFLVRACGLKVFPKKRVSSGFKPVFPVVLILILTGAGLFYRLEPSRVFSLIEQFQGKAGAVETRETASQARTTTMVDAYEIPPMPPRAEVADVPAPQSVPAMALPKTYGSLKVPKDVPLYSMVEKVYGTFNRRILTTLLTANTKIKNPNRIRAGMTIEFPVLDLKGQGWNPDTVCILFAKHSNFRKAYAAARQCPAGEVDVRILPLWKDPGFIFLVVVDRPFNTLASAKAFKQQISTTVATLCTPLEHAAAAKQDHKRILF
ncbi:MAG: AAA family ATPase [Desulfobacterium sp.]|nr:AAA family ATPase [Desulfobacterium sp.]